MPDPRESEPSALAALRAATAADHAAVDGAFAGFDLSDAAGYGRFLGAHARALPAVESAIGAAPAEAGAADWGLPPLRPRTALLAADLAGLGLARPAPLGFAAPADAAQAFGMAYVIEGSRLGGGLLARRVPPWLPRAYLAAVHTPGEWRAFGQALDRAAAGDPAWIAGAIAAARAVFAIYRAAADLAAARAE